MTTAGQVLDDPTAGRRKTPTHKQFVPIRRRLVLAALAREASGWFGTLHVVNGMVIGGLANRLREGASRRQRPGRRRLAA